MAKQNTLRSHEITQFASPFRDLVYRALVFSSLNGATTLYHVAGVQGGPWGAANALARSHRVHGGNCFYCKKGVPKGEATIDHVEPQSLGGSGLIQNLVIACKPCNASKSNQIIEHFKPNAGAEWLAALLEQVQQRLNQVNQASSQQQPSQDAAGGL